MVSSPSKRQGDFNFEKLNLLREVFFHHVAGASPYGAAVAVTMVNKGGIIQVKTIIIL